MTDRHGSERQAVIARFTEDDIAHAVHAAFDDLIAHAKFQTQRKPTDSSERVLQAPGHARTMSTISIDDAVATAAEIIGTAT